MNGKSFIISAEDEHPHSVNNKVVGTKSVLQISVKVEPEQLSIDECLNI